jgi:3-oxoadipate enol-lactonase
VTTAVTTATSADGTKIAWDARGEGPPLLLIHGLGYARWGWEPVLAPLAEVFRVLSFDNRGIGGSDAPPGPYSTARMAEDAAAVLDAAGAERAHVVGTSLGGMTAQELALGRPERVDRLVLACTTPGGPSSYPMPERTAGLIEAVASLPREERFRRFVHSALSEPYDEKMVDRIVAYRLEESQTLEAWQAQAAAALGFDVASRLGEIRAPTLVVTGTADEVVDARNSELLLAGIVGARLERFEGCGHLFFWQEPERFVRLVTEFLSRRLDGGDQGAEVAALPAPERERA